MSELRRIEELLRRTLEGDAWHGPALREILADVSAPAAAAHPVAGAHSIWELVLHATAWQEVVRRRLQGEPVFGLGESDNWPVVEETSEAAWQRARTELEASRARLLQTVRTIPESRLDETMPGGKVSNYVMLHGLVHHDLYHFGQIALLKRAQG